MSDYHYGPEDPLRRDDTYDPGGGSAWGWVAAAVFVVVVLGLLFAMNHQPGQLGTNTALNDTNPPVTRMAPPAQTVPPPTAAPAPGNPAPPTAPTPGNPAQQH